MSGYNLKVTLPPLQRRGLIPSLVNSIRGSCWVTRQNANSTNKTSLPFFLIRTGNASGYEVINSEEMEFLKQHKNKIDEIEDTKEWDTAKKITNPYELIYVSSRKSKIRSVAKYEPLSRSYFKLWEILQDYFRKPDYMANNNITGVKIIRAG